MIRVPQTIVFFLLAMIAAIAEGEPKDLKLSDAAEVSARQHLAAIKAELKTIPEHPWAGAYFGGDGLGFNTFLTLAPNAGFEFEWHGCLGVYDRNYGPVQFTNGRVRLSFAFENDRQGFQGIAPELIPVRWGPRRYLVAVDDIVGFCNKVNDGTEPRNDRHGFYLLRVGDEKLKAAGQPDVRREYRDYLLRQPIEAKIVAVGKYTTRPSAASWKFKDTPVTLNVGSSAGLKNGMELYVTDRKAGVCTVKITSTTKVRAEGIVTAIGEDEPDPKVGWHLSTRAPWH